MSFDRLNLSHVGALCEAIDLPDGHAHKLGLGKPFGLGSVLLKIDWNRSNVALDRDRYSSLKSRMQSLAAVNGTGGDAAATGRSRIAAEARRTFRGMVCTQSGQSAGNFERLPHVRQVRALTDWAHAPEPTSITYMPLNSPDREVPSYAVKPILDTPEQLQSRNTR